MKLYFLRHGKADWADWDKPDDERPLTKEGRREMRQIACFLRELGVSPSVILTSPLPRAQQTAELAAEALKVKLREEPLLQKGFTATKLTNIVRATKGADVMLVGHEPDFSAVIRELTGGMVSLKKGGFARVDLNAADASSGTLVWLIPPKIARRED
jgi:phosphohistidine phosphatase